MGKVDIGRRCHILHTQTTWIEWKYYVWFLRLISIFDLFLLQKIPGSTVARGNSYLTQKIYGSGGLLVTQMMELEIIPITAATLSWSRLINRDSSWVENQQHFLSFIYQLQLVLSSAALLACRPGFLCRSVQLPKQGGKKKKPQNRSRTEGPTGLCNGKQMAVSFDGSRLQSAVQERKLLIRCHPSSGLGAGGGGGQGEDRQSEAWHPTSGLFQTSSHWHIHGSPSNAHVKTDSTYMHSGLWGYSGSPLGFLPFINFIPLGNRSHDKVIPVFVNLNLYNI